MLYVLNWVWQGCVVAAAAAIALGLLRRCRAHLRYVVASAGLLAVLALPLAHAVDRGGRAGPGARDAAAADALLALPAGWWTSDVPVALAWAAWLVVCGNRLVRSVAALRRERSRCAPFPPELERRLTAWTSVRTRGRRPRLALSSGVRAAAVLGLGRPIIAVAPELLRRLAPDAIDRVVVHEWAHVRRRDDVQMLLGAVVNAVAGWHPAVWWLQRQLALERELACDEAAVAMTGCPRRYAASLATLVAISASRRQALAAVGVLSSPALRTRVVRILAAPRLASRRRSAALAGMAVVLLAVVTIAVAALPLVATNPRAPIVTAGAPPLAPPQAPRPSIGEPLRPGAGTVGRASPRPVPARKSLESPRGQGPSEAVRPAERVESGIPEPVAGAGSGLAAPGVDVTAGIRALPAPARAATAVREAGTRGAQGGETATPWSVAADAGMAVGRGSRNAASATSRATSGVFIRFGRKLATVF